MRAFSCLSALAAALPLCQATWPDLPFKVSGRDIISASGEKIVYAGVNWPGAADTMLPEGLQYNSIANIVGFVKSLGMNVVRLTYAIEMVDDIFEDSPNQSLQGTLTNALGETNGTKVLRQILKHNPQFTAQTTRLQVFDAVAEELGKQQIWVHLDNHVSKAKWCCSDDDGNAWFGDTYFNVAKWTRGLGFMAKHASHWNALASMSLRNELRQPSGHALPYTWKTWIDNVIPAANAIHGNNSKPLVFFSGLDYDTDDTYFIDRETRKGKTFTPLSYVFKDKIVYEIHNYENGATSCDDDIKPNLYRNAYCAMNLTDKSCPNHGPVVMTEFGFDQDGGADSVYAQCIKSTVTQQPGGPGGWMQWVLSGSYYIREGTQDYDETWGLLNHKWSHWRNATAIRNYVRPFVQESL